MEYIAQDNVVILDGEIIFHGRKIPTPPGYKRGGNRISVCNHKLYVNGFEWKHNEWRRTTGALLHNMV